MKECVQFSMYIADMNRRTVPAAIALAAVSIGAALILVAGLQGSASAPMLLDPSLNDISSAFSETDRASEVLSNEGGLSLVGRDYEVLLLRRLVNTLTA
jgi:hypothetical protein